MAPRTFATLLLVFAAFVCLGALQARASDDSVRIGGNITIEPGQSVDDVVCIGGSVVNHGDVKGDIVVIGGTLTSDSDISGDTVVMGGHARIDNHVGGDSVVLGGILELGSAGEIAGEAVALGGGIQQAPGSVIHGQTQSLPGPWWLFGVSGIGILIVLGLLTAAPLSLLTAMLSYAIAGRRRVEAVAHAARVSTAQAFGVGFAVIAAVLLMVWIATFMHPVTPFVILAIFIAFVITVGVGLAGASSWVGRRLASNAGPFAVVVIGAIVLQLLVFIPFVGWAIFAFVVLVALGSAVLSGWGETPYWLANRI